MGKIITSCSAFCKPIQYARDDLLRTAAMANKSMATSATRRRSICLVLTSFPCRDNKISTAISNCKTRFSNNSEGL